MRRHWPGRAHWAVMKRSPRGSLRRVRLRGFACGWCGRQVFVCGRCNRGQRYCSRSCSRKARQAYQREASRCYQSTEAGKAKHAARSSRYRRRQRECRKRVRVTQQGLAFSGEKVLNLRSTSCGGRCCVVCGAPWPLRIFRRSPGRRTRRVAPWKTRRRCRRAWSSSSFISWSLTTHLCVFGARTRRVVFNRAWRSTVSSSRW